jgi:hypothetical protein
MPAEIPGSPDIPDRSRPRAPKGESLRAGLPADVEIRMDEFTISQPGEILETEGLGPCVGIAFDARVAKRGAMGHFPDYSREEIAGLAQSFFEETGAQPEEVVAYLRGASPAGPVEEYITYADAVREEAEEGVRASGILPEKTNVLWQRDSTQSASMRLDTETGEFTSRVEAEDL